MSEYTAAGDRRQGRRIDRTSGVYRGVAGDYRPLQPHVGGDRGGTARRPGRRRRDPGRPSYPGHTYAVAAIATSVGLLTTFLVVAILAAVGVIR